MSFPRYPAYKDSGVGWLGEVPRHWAARKLTDLARLESGHTPSRQHPEYWIEADCVIPWFTLADVGFLRDERNYLIEGTSQHITEVGIANSAARRLPAGTVLLSRTASVGFSGIAGIELAVSQDFAAWICSGAIRPAYLLQCLRAMKHEFRRLMMGSTHQTIYMPDIEAFRVPLPPVAEQVAIGAFLDREMARIDELVAEQEGLIELLTEKRQAVIAHAVTKGLNRSVRLKDSGVKWLGSVPEHWGVIQSRRLFAVRSEPALATDRMLTASQKHGVLFQADYVELEGRRVVEVIMGVESLKHVEPDDFIISMRSFQGGIEWCKLRGSTSFHYVMLKPIKAVHPPFFAHLFKSTTYIQALRATTDLIRDGQELRYSNFAQVDLPLVPAEEQARIAEFLDHEIPKLDALVTEAQRAIYLLHERRTALISAAVTGDIDVRGTHTPEARNGT